MQTYQTKRKAPDRAVPPVQEAAPSKSEMLHLSGAGAPQPMSPALREKFEPGFSADFSNIRISRGHIPEELGVQAVAQGTDILLDQSAGMDVLGHELAHVVQQAQGRVVFTGFIHNDKLPDYYRAADAACFPALWDEPAGITAIEAMACGCPVVATRSGGMPEYLEETGAPLVDRDEIVYGTLTAPRPEARPMAESLLVAIKYLRVHPRIRARIKKACVARAQAFSRQAYYENFCRLAGVGAPAQSDDPAPREPEAPAGE